MLYILSSCRWLYYWVSDDERRPPAAGGLLRLSERAREAGVDGWRGVGGGYGRAREEVSLVIIAGLALFCRPGKGHFWLGGKGGPGK